MRAVWSDGTVVDIAGLELEAFDLEADRAFRISDAAEAAIKAVTEGYGASLEDEDEYAEFIQLVRSGLSPG